MKEILLTSSALILALLVLRRLFRRALSRRVQYALWGLVLLRLLVPVSLPAAGFSLLTAAEPVVEDFEALYLEPQSVTVRSRYGGPVMGVPGTFPAAVGPATPDNSRAFSYQDALEHPVDGVLTYKRQILLEDLLPPIWYGGMTVMACWLVLSNLLFWRKLRKHRKPYAGSGARLPVYLVESGLPSPCLFGLFRPAVYLTSAAIASPDSLRHVLAHEETHARHLDPLWSLLRGVCLTVYWFDPLVWWAALASRTDCELACDEGALRRLGEAERIPYGRTLLSLIPVRRVPADPFLAATTMTSDKRRLMDRIARIAEDRKTLGTALFAAIALAALVCAVTFTGAKGTPSGSLSQEELDYFNGEFFTEAYGRGENRRAQFLTTLYDSPQNIDLYELLYNGTGLPEEITDADRKYMEDRFGESGLSEDGYIKLSVTNIEAFLLENTGISARDDHRYWQGGFWWNEANAAYYNIFADSGLRRPSGPIVFTSGQREGDTVRLYYLGMFSSEDGDHSGRRGPACLTLLERPEGGWWFVSNEWALAGQVSAAPDWDPILTISLDGLEPYEPEPQYRLSIDYSGMEMLDSMVDPYGILGGRSLVFFQDGRGRVYAGFEDALLSSRPLAFLALPGDLYSVSWFRDLLGHDGFAIHCDARIQVKEDPPTYRFNGYPFTDYYYLDDGGQPVLLASLPGFAPTALDLDGDGERELVSWGYQTPSLCFRRDGKYYQANVKDLLEPFWPPDTIFSCDTWDAVSRSLSFDAWIHSYSSVSYIPRYEHRTLYFDGESLLVYNDQRHSAGHMAEGLDLPAAVHTAALEAARQAYHAAGSPYDDWRIDRIDGGNLLEVDGQRCRVWRISCEFHTPEPRKMPGLDAQDCWADPFYPESLYLVFRDNSPDEFQTDLTCLFSTAWEGWPTEEQISERLAQMPDLSGTAAAQAQAALDELMSAGTVRMTLTAPERGGSYDADPQAGNGPNRADFFTRSFDWRFLSDEMGDERAPVAPVSPLALEIAPPDGRLGLSFASSSDRVLLRRGEEQTWLYALPKDDPEDPSGEDIFDFMRWWYDEAEHDGLTGDAVIPDRGQSRLEIAREWVDLHLRANLQATGGSKYAFTYGRASVELEEDIPEDLFPEWTAGMERFYFSYEEIFVLENDEPATRSWNWEGGAAKYEGDDAPEGALSRWHIGFLYKTEEGWRCGGVGTRP